MQIALTKKLATAIKVKVPAADENVDPVFSWTANWTRVWENRKAEDMLVLVNNATRFTVVIYEVKRARLKNVEQIMTEAIKNTLNAMDFNPEMIEAYMQMAGDVTFVKNSDRKATSWVNRAGLESAIYIGDIYNGIDKMYNDTIGVFSSKMIVNSSKNPNDAFIPYEVMGKQLSELTGKTAYQ